MVGRVDGFSAEKKQYGMHRSSEQRSACNQASYDQWFAQAASGVCTKGSSSFIGASSPGLHYGLRGGPGASKNSPAPPGRPARRPGYICIDLDMD